MLARRLPIAPPKMQIIKSFNFSIIHKDRSKCSQNLYLSGNTILVHENHSI